MAEAVEVIARAMCDENLRQEGRPVWPCDPECGPGCECPKLKGLARAVLSALEGEGFKVIRIVTREPEPWVFEPDGDPVR